MPCWARPVFGLCDDARQGASGLFPVHTSRGEISSVGQNSGHRLMAFEGRRGAILDSVPDYVGGLRERCRLTGTGNSTVV